MDSRQQHWDSVYRDNDDTQVGWYQANPTRSLNFIRACAVAADSPVINIGGGSSVLVDRLLDENYTDVSVLDISATALDLARDRLGSRADQVNWIQGDVTEHRFDRVYQVWLDRAAFHFLIDSAEQDDYIKQLRHVVSVGGHVIIATFSVDGPERCSGLLVQRYSEESLQERMGSEFEPVRFERETHRTPSGVSQEFLYGHFLRMS